MLMMRQHDDADLRHEVTAIDGTFSLLGHNDIGTEMTIFDPASKHGNLVSARGIGMLRTCNLLPSRSRRGSFYGRPAHLTVRLVRGVTSHRPLLDLKLRFKP